MSNVLIVSPSDFAHGFRLAGLEVREAASPDESERLLRSPAVSGFELVVVPQDHYMAYSERFIKELEAREKPLCVPVPMQIGSEKLSPEQYVQDLVRRVIGYQIKV